MYQEATKKPPRIRLLDPMAPVTLKKEKKEPERTTGPGMMTGFNTPCTKEPPGSHQGATEDQTFGSIGPSDAQEREEEPERTTGPGMMTGFNTPCTKEPPRIRLLKPLAPVML